MGSYIFSPSSGEIRHYARDITLKTDPLGVMRLRGWRYGVFVGGFFGFISVCCYASMIQPMLNPEPYKRIRDRAFSDRPT